MLYRHTVLYVLLLGVLVFVTNMLPTVTFSQAQPTSFPQVASMLSESTPPQSTHTTFTVQFTHAVTGVDLSDFMVTTQLPNVFVYEVTTTSDPSTYHVSVSHGPQNGQFLLLLVDDDSIVNGEGLALGGNGEQNGNAVSNTVELESTSSLSTSAATPRVGGVNVGTESDIALTNSKKSKNIPVIAYYDDTNKKLKLAICDTLICDYPTIQTIGGAVSGNSVDWGRSPSIALAKGEIPVISYYDVTNGDLWLTICKDALCKKFTSRIIDGVSTDAGEHSAIALTTKDVPIISYSNYTDSNQMLAVCNSAACSIATLTTIDYANYGSWNDMRLSSKGFPVIVSYDTIHHYLGVFVCNNLTCTSKDSTALSGEYFTNPSLALTRDDIPVVSYFDSNLTELKILYCQNTTCSAGFSRATIESSCECIPKVILDSSDIPVIAYTKYDGANYSAYLAKCSSLSCIGPTVTSLDGVSPSWGVYPDIAITDTDVPVISSYDVTNGRLILHFDLPAIDDGTPPRFLKATATTTAQGATATVTLKWQVALGATSYEYCIAQSTNDCYPASTSWTSAGNTTSATVAFLPRVTTFYWQVRAVNSAGSTLANGGFATLNTK